MGLARHEADQLWFKISWLVSKGVWWSSAARTEAEGVWMALVVAVAAVRVALAVVCTAQISWLSLLDHTVRSCHCGQVRG